MYFIYKNYYLFLFHNVQSFPDIRPYNYFCPFSVSARAVFLLRGGELYAL